MKTFEQPEGHDCGISTGLHGGITFGTGRLYDSGYWSKPCEICARAWEKQFPENTPCWPFGPKSMTLKSVSLDDLKPNTYYLIKWSVDEWYIVWLDKYKKLFHACVESDIIYHNNVKEIYELPKI